MSSNDEHEEYDLTREDSDALMNYAPDPETTCMICHAEFLEPDDLKIHIHQVHKIASCVLRKCNFCTQEYSDLMEYAEHVRDTHITNLKCCNYCWRFFNNNDEFRSHIKKHSVRKTNTASAYGCSVCENKFADRRMLRRHEFDHKSSTEGVMLYDLLPYLSVALKVKAMTFIEALGADVVYLCAGCSLSTVDMDSYMRHVRENACNVFVCAICSNIYGTRRSLAKHCQSSCSILGKAVKMKLCPDCNTYIGSEHYTKHKIVCKPIKCYTCDITFATMNDWTEHQSKEHAGYSVEVETCKYCWKRCVGSVAMQKHVDKTHRPEFHLYKYLCVYCKSVFKHPQKLFGHFVTRHKDIFPYTCKICDKTFRFRKKFTIHIKLTHKSEGFVEFDENYHVFFTDKKSEKPFVPKSLYVDETPQNQENIIENTDNAGLNSDFMNATETEGNQTEAEIKVKPKLKRKRAVKARKELVEDIEALESSDDDQPLLTVRKRVKLQKKYAKIGVIPRSRTSSKAPLTCKICNKYCYTFQNYKHHISLHSKHDVKKCIKCSKDFKSGQKLNEHIAKEHSTSRLTETLKTLLEKRKTGGSITEDLSTTAKFRRTIMRVKSDATDTPAKLIEVDHKLSVQKFFENFVPEEIKNEGTIESNTSIKLVSSIFPREPTIKMTRFKPTPINTSFKLAMPVKFVDHYPEKTTITMKIINAYSFEKDTKNDYSDHYEDDMDRHESIPEVAEEVMLEGTEETPKTFHAVPHKIVIPKLPTAVTDMRIAHLLPEAPFYKIVKVKDVLSNNEDKNDNQPTQSVINLPSGTKLVTTNPLAHLLGNQQDKILESVKNKYYKPKNKNVQSMLAKALTKLDKPTTKKKKKEETGEVKVEEE